MVDVGLVMPPFVFISISNTNDDGSIASYSKDMFRK